MFGFKKKPSVVYSKELSSAEYMYLEPGTYTFKQGCVIDSCAVIGEVGSKSVTLVDAHGNDITCYGSLSMHNTVVHAASISAPIVYMDNNSVLYIRDQLSVFTVPFLHGTITLELNSKGHVGSIHILEGCWSFIGSFKDLVISVPHLEQETNDLMFFQGNYDVSGITFKLPEGYKISYSNDKISAVKIV